MRTPIGTSAANPGGNKVDRRLQQKIDKNDLRLAAVEAGQYTVSVGKGLKLTTKSVGGATVVHIELEE